MATTRSRDGKPFALGRRGMPARFGYVPSLDGLRAASIAVVVLCHIFASRALIGFSAFGVVVFFCLSGFLITRLLLAEARRTGTVDIRAFYWRRILRLYPVVLLLLGLATLVASGRGAPIDGREVAAALFYWTNDLVDWRELHAIPIDLPIGTLWSLAVEEQFYIAMPFVLFALRRRPGVLALVAVGVSLAALLIRTALMLRHPELVGTLATYRRSEMRCDAIAVGVLLAALAEFPRGRRLLVAFSTRPAMMTAAGALLLSFAIRNEFFKDTLRFSVQSFALLPIFCNILFADSFVALKRALNLRPVCWLGRLSYSLYVWHASVGFFLGSLLLALPAHGRPFARLAFALIFACLSYYGVERPVLRLRDRATRKAAPRHVFAAPSTVPAV